MRKKEIPTSTDAKLEEIIEHLRRMDKRDRMRMFGASIKGIISIIPVLVFLWGAWYMYQNGDAVLQKIAAEAAKQAAQVSKSLLFQ
ncbi:hypothetical protein H6770_03570 [Candidatus Peribacteria bacterium]|nr:hypothetical protein [Candidatus Peribacteria bacterium]